MAQQPTPGAGSRRTQTTAFGHTIFVTPPARKDHATWSANLERRALESGYVAVINGEVCWPFPANGQPKAWTPAQVAAHAAQQRTQLGEALL